MQGNGHHRGFSQIQETLREQGWCSRVDEGECSQRELQLCFDVMSKAKWVYSGGGSRVGVAG